HGGLSTPASQLFHCFRVPSLLLHSSARTMELRITAGRNQVPLKRFDAYSSSSSCSDENYRYGKKSCQPAKALGFGSGVIRLRFGSFDSRQVGRRELLLRRGLTLGASGQLRSALPCPQE